MELLIFIIMDFSHSLWSHTSIRAQQCHFQWACSVSQNCTLPLTFAVSFQEILPLAVCQRGAEAAAPILFCSPAPDLCSQSCCSDSSSLCQPFSVQADPLGVPAAAPTHCYPAIAFLAVCTSYPAHHLDFLWIKQKSPERNPVPSSLWFVQVTQQPLLLFSSIFWSCSYCISLQFDVFHFHMPVDSKTTHGFS